MLSQQLATQAVMPPANGGGSFLGGLGDVFLGGLDKYMQIRQAEKMYELTGEAQYLNNMAVEPASQPNATPAQTAGQQGGNASSGQWINGVDNTVVILGAAGVLGALILLK